MNLLRGGGGDKSAAQQKLRRAIAQKKLDEEKEKEKEKTSKGKATAAKVKARFVNGPPVEAIFVQEHWNVPIRKQNEMQHGGDGVCLVSHDSFQSMYDILKLGEGTSALLAPTHFDFEGEFQQIIVWARKGD